MILGIESSADFPSVALIDVDGNVVKEWVSPEKQSHSEQLPLFVKNAFDFAMESSQEIKAVAVNSGPGSYTGLRIGTSLAKGLCYGKSIKLIAVNGLQAMANFVLKQHPEVQTVWSMLDARRDEVFIATQNQGEPPSQILAQILTEDAIALFPTKNPLAFIGNANFKAVNLTKLNPEIEIFGPYTHQWAAIAAAHFNQGLFEDVAYFEPFYLKDFVPGIAKKFKL